MFEIKNVSKQYNGEFALRDVSFSIGKGLNFIIGASGSGKTTLLKIMSGMEQSFDGDVFYLGKSIKTLATKEKSYYYNHIFGFVWQNFNLLEDMTVLENIILPGYLKDNQDKKAIRKILHDLKISELADQKVKHLSGGQKQRISIARIFLKNPPILILDEATSALDNETEKVIQESFIKLSESRTTLVIAHRLATIRHADRIMVLTEDGIVEEGCHDSLLQDEGIYARLYQSQFESAV